MRIYLAARYSRRLELCGYREILRGMDHRVQATWLDGKHQIDEGGKPIGDDGESLIEGDEPTNCAAMLRAKFAGEDFADVLACDLLIAFTETPRSGHSRGGRHVELGIALGYGKEVIIVGPRENIFCWLPQVRHFETFEEMVEVMKANLSL